MTAEPLAYENGRLVRGTELSVPVYDQGFVQGVAVAEQMRTFGGKLFRFPEHLQRLRRSLEVVQVDPGLTDDQMIEVAKQLVDHNWRLMMPHYDLGLCLFVTPGPYPTFAASPGEVPAEDLRPRVVMHTFPLPFASWADKYRTGQALVVSKHLQVPGACWPSWLKCRSRMHYFLADKEAMARDPNARALLLDENGFVIEASTANVFAHVVGEGIVAPPIDDVLPGISLLTVCELAGGLGIPVVRRPMTAEQLSESDEVMLCSTSMCTLPVNSIDGKPIHDGRPGPVFQQLIEAWSERVGLDVVEQATSCAGL